MLSFVPTPIGNLEDITFRALDRLRKAEVFFCEDTRVTKRLLALLADRFGASFYESPVFVSLHSHNEQSAIDRLDRAVFDRPCVFASDAGMPCVSDPGALLAAWCVKNGVKFEALPGANAAITAYAASGEGSGRFAFYGFLPHKSEARKSALGEIARLSYPIIFYESPHRIAEFAADLSAILPDRSVAAFKELTKLHEKRFDGSTKDFAAAIGTMNTKGEWTIVLFPPVADTRASENEWLIDALVTLGAPTKPLSKILARLTGEKPSIWYERLK
ncbi:ribosomal RNA small subunit methyltransferase I [Campylobacterota bacterium]|nr:ribosomal RNA small subunit methyltransferase I [Campylobacterota bacterium]